MNQSFDKLFCPRIAKCNSHCTIYIQGVKGESGKSLSSKFVMKQTIPQKKALTLSVKMTP